VLQRVDAEDAACLMLSPQTNFAVPGHGLCKRRVLLGQTVLQPQDGRVANAQP
jgi:hypothetical protein